VSFQAAYLKVHHPAEFMAAVISNQGGYYATFAYVSEARRMGLRVLPPDVTDSRQRWTGRRATVRVGLQAVKGLGSATAARIVAARRRQPFRDAADFLNRVRPDETEAQALIRCGALDALAGQGGRAGLMWTLACWQRCCDRPPVHDTLFEALPEKPPPGLPEEDALERLRREFAVLGFLCDRHPIGLYAGLLQSRKTVKAQDLGRWLGRRVRFGGWFIAGKVVHTKQGDPMEFLTFEDETDTIETTFFPAVYHRFCHMLDWGRPYLLTGRVEMDWGAVTLTVDHIAPLPPVRLLTEARKEVLHRESEMVKLISQAGDSGRPGRGLAASR
jgi:DNA polymerase-3 subunit alpha/error-prone DNA polymerase